MAENMPSGSAQRPSDVMTTYGGRTVEVLNTDAEGRLVLADGIVAASEEHPDLIVDVATLTGHQVVALGTRVSAVMSNDDHLRDQIGRVAKRTGEQFWPMPLPPELRASMDSQVADIANMGERMGGMLVAGLFLKEFVGNQEGSEEQIPWAHLDIAGPAFNGETPFGYTPKGGTGVAVRTLVALAEDLVALAGPLVGGEPAALAGVPLPHPGRVAGELHVVDRYAELLGQPGCGPLVRDPPPGPLAVGGDEHDRRRRHRGARLDVHLDARAGWRRSPSGGPSPP